MSDATDPLRIARFVSDQTERNRLVQRLGFPNTGEIGRFLTLSYGKAISQIVYSDRPKGHMFVLEPAVLQGQIAQPDKLVPVIHKIRKLEQDSILSLPLDLGKSERVVASPTKDDLDSRVGGAWLRSHAQQLSSSLDKCVVLANGATVSVFVSGTIHSELDDVIDGLDKGPQDDFQKIPWDNGEILYFFAEHDLNDRSSLGIWRLPDKFVLKSNPETWIAERLHKFLRFRMPGMLNLEHESHVEHEGRLDLALYLVNGFIYIVEIKWMGKSIKKSEQLQTDEQILDALKEKKNWFTDFDDEVIDSGLKQVVIYCAGGKFRRGYVSVFDCQSPSKSKTDRNIAINNTDGQDPGKFRVIRAAVDPRTASVRSKS